MQARLSQQALRSGGTIPRPIASPDGDDSLLNSQYSNSANIRVPPPPEQFGSPSSNFFMEDVPISPGYRFSDVGQLPQWAKKKTSVDESSAIAVAATPSIPLSSSPGQSGSLPKTRGRWAQKGPFEPDELRATSPADPTVSSTTSTPAPYPIPIIQTNHNVNNNQTSDYNSGSSKDIYTNTYLSEDSSIDSGMENRRDLLFLGGGKSVSLNFDVN